MAQSRGLNLGQFTKPRVLLTVAITALVGVIVVRTIANRLNLPQLNQLIDRGL